MNPSVAGNFPYRFATNIPGSSIKLPNVMDCDALAWYEKQDEALQTRIRMLACFTANLQKGDWRQLLPGACRGARDDRIIFDAIADMLIAPLLGERVRQTVMRSSLKDIAASMRGGHF